MLASIYGWALAAYPLLIWLTALACWAGAIANIGGTRRIALVIAGATVIVAALALAGWPVLPRLFALTVVNALAAVPLLIHPVTSRQQFIAATYLAQAVMHCVFAVSASMVGALPPSAVTVNWALGSAVDAAQAVLLLWWSGGHAVRVAVDHIRRRGDASSGAAPVRRTS